jgi:hypothetical protein
VKKIIKKTESDITLCLFEFGDVGRCRYEASRNLDCDIISFLDADDFCSENWIHGVLNSYKRNRSIFFHPEIIYALKDGEMKYSKQKNLKPTNKNLKKIYFRNLWISTFASEYKSFEKLDKFSGATNSGNIYYAYEDWSLYAESLKKNFYHKVIKKSFVISRTRLDGNTKKTIALQLIPKIKYDS